VRVPLRSLDRCRRHLGELHQHLLVEVREFAFALVERLDQPDLLAVRSAEGGDETGVSYRVEWVTIDEPDTTFAPGTTNDQALVFVGDQGRAKGGAIFSRLEGSFYDSDKVYLVSTQGGDTPAGEPAPAGYGDGFGQLWVYDTRRERITLLFESPSRTVLELPDNLCISPQKASLLCEDGPTENYLRGVTRHGQIFDFALNAIPQRMAEEFAGATFTPDGKVLFVNIQASSGLTFAIWGPWKKGAL
jgi:uncharacterized protein